jgi:hypothetical protein
MIVIPPNAMTPPDEPAQLPISNPAELQELMQMIAENRWNQWIYDGACFYSKNPNGTTKVVRVHGITPGMLKARIAGVIGAWPLPGQYGVGVWPYGAPANMVTLIQPPA